MKLRDGRVCSHRASFLESLNVRKGLMRVGNESPVSLEHRMEERMEKDEADR